MVSLITTFRKIPLAGKARFLSCDNPRSSASRRSSAGNQELAGSVNSSLCRDQRALSVDRCRRKLASNSGGNSVSTVWLFLEAEVHESRGAELSQFTGFFLTFLLLFTLNAQGRYRPHLKPFFRDFFSTDLADAKGAILNALKGFSDFGQELAFPIPHPQDKISVRFKGCAVCGVGKGIVLIRHSHHGVFRFRTNLIHPFVEERFEKLKFLFIHSNGFTTLT
jgi:hypothetical protein